MEVTQQGKTRCYCNTLPILAHELNQSLQIIQAYVKGCSERIKENCLGTEQLSTVLSKINEQVDTMDNKIQFIIKTS